MMNAAVSFCVAFKIKLRQVSKIKKSTSFWLEENNKHLLNFGSEKKFCLKLAFSLGSDGPTEKHEFVTHMALSVAFKL